MKALTLAFATVAVSVVVTSAGAVDNRYLDDRSSPATLVGSLYNAINRKEYARAWDYFGDTKPAKDFDAFVKGYENTTEVTVMTGAVASEGAAGGTFYHLPVAITAFTSDGASQTFAGCYVARLSNPQIQGTPFQPLHLEKGSLALMKDATIADAVPTQCPDAPPPDTTDALLERVKATFASMHTECDSVTEQVDADRKEPESYLIKFRPQHASEDEPEQEARLFRFFCSMGAYNETHIYYLYKELEGLQEQHFAAPELDIRYENETSDEKLESVTIIGFRSDSELVNSFYDEATRSIGSFDKWRGIGDASSSGSWMFREGTFTLVKYDVDATYDGEINPQTVVDYATPP